MNKKRELEIEEDLEFQQKEWRAQRVGTVDSGFSWLQRRIPALGRVLEGLPVVLVEHGRLLEDRARREGITLSEILAAGREKHGLERLDQFKYAILERHGGISVVPTEKAR